MKYETDIDFIEYHRQINSLFENGHIVMLLINPQNGDITDANPAACKFYGYSRDEIKKMKITDINILSNKEVFQEMRSANNSGHNTFIFKHRLSKGEIRDVEVFSGPIRMHNENLLYSIIFDITEKVKSQRKIQESEARYRKLIELSPNSIMVFQDFKIVFANRKMAEMMGCFEPKELIGRDILNIIHPDYVKTSLDRIKKINRGFDAPLIVSKLVNNKGESIDIEITSNALIYNGKECIQSIIRDITDRKKIEEQLYRYTDQLEKGLEIAREIQEKHLPQQNQIEGIDIEILYEPLMELGGDYCKVVNDCNTFIDYEFDESINSKEYKLDSETYGILMGDVVGKGPSAAMVTNEILSFLNYYNLRKQTINPSEFFSYLNKYLYNIGTKNMYLSTAGYYSINILLGKLKYSNAGHEKAILYRQNNNSTTWLKTEGTILGVSVPELIEFEEETLYINIGDKLILYSDGVTELRDNEGSFFGDVRLYELINKYGYKPAKELKAIIEKELLEHSKSSQYQDDCIVAVIEFKSLGKKTYEIPNNMKYVEISLKVIGQTLRNIGMHKECISDIKLVLRQTLKNEIVNGNNNFKKVSIILELTPDNLIISVKDYGKILTVDRGMF